MRSATSAPSAPPATPAPPALPGTPATPGPSAPPATPATPPPPAAPGRGESAMLIPPWGKVSARGHRKVRGPAEVDPAIPHHVTVERQAREPGGETLEGDAGLQPGERCAQAVMRPGAERHVLPRVLPAQVQFGGLRAPEPLVPVGRAEARHDERARGNRDAAHRDRLHGDPPARLHRAVVPEQFLDS